MVMKIQDKIKELFTLNSFKQVFKYGFVGVCAAITQYGIVILWVHLCHMSPLRANPIGFACGFIVSFLGHRFITFHTSRRKMQVLLLHFTALAGVNFVLNQTLFYIFLHYFKIHYAAGLPIVILISASIVFVLNKFWVFHA